MSYSGDRKNIDCQKCKKKVTLVRCSPVQNKGCNGKGNGMTTQCSWCPGDGYACENQKDQHHQYRSR